MADVPMPVVAPADSCVGCLKGDTSTAVRFTGSMLFIAQSMARFMPKDQAIAMSAERLAEQDEEAGREFDEDRTYSLAALVCEDCASDAGFDVARVRRDRDDPTQFTGEIPTYANRT